MLSLPPLEGLRFFEAAARHESFKHAATELGVTPAAVGYRIRALEQHLDVELFDRHQRGVNLNRHGRAYLEDVKRILAEVHNATERHRRRPRRVRVVSVEAVAERWLTPRLASLEAAHPGITIELETDHRGVDVGRRDFDAWIAYTGETAAPRPTSQRGDTLLEETLYQEQLLPVCSPGLLKARGRPESPADLWGWPLLYDLGWDSDWAYWATQQNQPAPDLTRASGFRLYSILIDAATQGVGAAIGRTTLIERELQHRTLVPALQHQEDAPERCCLITTEASRQRPEVQALRQWLLQQTQTTNQPANHPNP